MVMGEFTEDVELLVVGSGPGGYAAAFRAADLGLDVAMVDMDPKPGGVCLNRGCIPSKALLHVSELINDAQEASAFGLTFGEPKIDVDKIRGWKDGVVSKLTDGLLELCKKRGVQFIKGKTTFESSDTVRLQDAEVRRIRFRHAILATGSRPSTLQGISINEDGRVFGSTGALKLSDIPKSMLIVGGGYVALEMGSVYASLGTEITLVVHRDRLVRPADPDLVAPLKRRLESAFKAIHFNTKVKSLKEFDDRVEVSLEGEGENADRTFDRVLVAVGRDPNTQGLGLENTQVKLNDRGYVVADDQQRTSDPKILAIGDVVGGYMLAHKAMREGKIAAEVIAGKSSAFDVRAIPAVVYTTPQIAWCGLTEESARAKGIRVEVSRFPWKYSGRALSMEAPEGMTKMIVNPEDGRILGVGVVGRQAEGIIAEAVLAMEMGAVAEDLALTIHAHPTLSETEGEAAEIIMGTSTHVLPKSGKNRAHVEQ